MDIFLEPMDGRAKINIKFANNKEDFVENLTRRYHMGHESCDSEYFTSTCTI